MELKLKKYRRLLKERGETVSEEEDDDDDNDNDDYVENDKKHELTSESKIVNDVAEPAQPQPTNLLLNFTEAKMNSNYSTPFVMNNHNNHINENNFTSSSSDQIKSFSQTPNPIIDSFSNTFQDHFSLIQSDNSQPQTAAELQNYFK